MPDEHDNETAEDAPRALSHAHAEDREDEMEGEVGGGEGDEQDADTAETTGGATSGGPGGSVKARTTPPDV